MIDIGFYYDLFKNKTLYKTFPYFRYQKDIKNNGIYQYCNFWYSFNSKDFRIYNFIENNNLNPNKKKIDFFSVFGPRGALNYSKNIKIFFTGEYIGDDRFKKFNDYCLNDVNLSIGFREYDLPNYVRFPLWITYLVNPVTLDKNNIENAINDIESKKETILNREKKFALIASHDDIQHTRSNIYETMSKISVVHCPGKFMHNINVRIPKYEDKIHFLKDYIFNICPENKISKGYVTEKLIDSWLSGCLPIYNGEFGELEKQIFNKDRIIYINSDTNKMVTELLNNKEKMSNYTKQPIFKKDASSYIYTYLKRLYDALKVLLK